MTTRRARLRKAWWVVHRYLGLTIGLYLAVIAATGSLLVFHDEIDAQTRPAPAAPHSAPITASLTLPSMNHPLSEIRSILFARYGAEVGAEFTTFQFPRGPNNLYTTTGKINGQAVTLAIDLARGQIVQAAPTHSSPLVWVEDLHENLLRGAAGFAANGWAALAAMVLLVSGVVLFLGSLSPVAPRGYPGDRETKNFHTLLGVFTLALLIVNTLTGAALVFNDPVEHAVYRLTETPPHPGPAVAPFVPTAKIATLDTLLDNARTAAPDAEVVFVTLPHRPGQAFYVLLQKQSGILPYISVYLQPETGTVLRVDRDDSAPLGRRIMGSVPALHEGTWGGLPVKILYAAVGLAPLTLYATGCLMWFRRVGLGSKLRRRKRHAVE